MTSQRSAAARLNRSVRVFFSGFVRASLARPLQALHYARTVYWQSRAARRRRRMAAFGLSVPPIAIFSITHRCNLRCKGCYARAIRGEQTDALNTAQLADIVDQADRIGISFFVVVGGEPLTRPEIVDIAACHPRVVFLLVTNGTLLDRAMIQKVRLHPNIVPVLSIEGDPAQTDARRGRGVHDRLAATMAALRRAGVFFSLSFTVTRGTFDTVTDPDFLRRAVGQGCKLFFFIEYTPLDASTEGWMITGEQRARMKGLVASFRRRFPAVFTAVPWDEEEQGGCLAAGRGFVHISASGDLEPCPFAPYSDTSLLDVPLRVALRSPFLRTMREKHALFQETTGGCALWRNREAVRALLIERTG